MSQENVEIVRSLYAGAAKLRCLDRGMSMPGWNRLTPEIEWSSAVARRLEATRACTEDGRRCASSGTSGS